MLELVFFAHFVLHLRSVSHLCIERVEPWEALVTETKQEFWTAHRRRQRGMVCERVPCTQATGRAETDSAEDIQPEMGWKRG